MYHDMSADNMFSISLSSLLTDLELSRLHLYLVFPGRQTNQQKSCDFCKSHTINNLSSSADPSPLSRLIKHST